MSILGTRVQRVEDPGFLTRGGVYTDDVVDEQLAGALFATFVRSPIAHARMVGIDVAGALEAPGVVAVYTAANLPDAPSPQPAIMAAFPPSMAQPLLAIDVVRYVGQQVAVILTTDRYTGEDAAELVVVDYDPLPAVVDPRDAARDKELLFPEAGTNTVNTNGIDLDPSFFDGCEVVVSHEVLNQRVAAAPLEVRAGAGSWRDGRYTLWCSNQGAQGQQQSVADQLGVDKDLVRIITPDVGGGFGAKFGSAPEHAVILLAARDLGRPVRWIETRSENLLVMPQGRGQIQQVTLGGRRDGTVEAFQLEVLQDSGGYAFIGALLPQLTALMAPAVYAFPKVVTSWKSVVTNTTPTGAYRGAGRPEAAAAVERAMDLWAAELGIDPVEVRRRNLLPAFDEPHKTLSGAMYDNGDYEAAMDLVLASADYARLRREQAVRRERGDVVQLGIGLAVYVEITGGGGGEAGGPSENATVEIHPDGSATILTGTSPHGQGHQTVWAMLASEELGIPIEAITVKWGDTDLVPEGGGTGGSRSLQQGGAAVQLAAQDLIELAKSRAADELEVDPGDLRIDKAIAGLSVAGVPGASITFAELASRERLFVRSIFQARGATFPFGAHVAVVDVDTESGKATLRRLIAVDDAGTVINPLLAEGQRHGGLAQGAAQALLEEVVYDSDGNPNTTTFADYPIVTATELPSFELVDMATPTKYNPLGAKGIGESGSVGSTPAVQNAVIDAVAHLGVRHIDMPTTPQRIWRAINEAKERTT